MKFSFLHTPLLLAATLGTVAADDWPQWRGPLRNGAAVSSVPLIDAVPASGLKELWASEPIPSADDGGLGSVVVANGRAYLSVVWHREVPSETRTFTDVVLRNLGSQNFKSIGEAKLAKLEADRMAMPPTLRGAKLEAFIDEWIKTNLDKKQQQIAGGWVGARFKKGRLAIPIEDYEKLEKQQDKPFPTEAAFKAWVESQGFAEQTKAEVYAKVPPTKRVAEDTVVCIELASGKTLWKTAVPGEPKGRNCSSTPAVVDGKVYALGSAHAHCVDALSGKRLWSAPLAGKGPGSSPLVTGGKVFANAGQLLAFDAATGKELWKQPKAGGTQSSPVSWTDAAGKELIVCNSRNGIVAVQPATGEIAWTAPGGGDSTPVIAGNRLAVQVKDPKLGFVVYDLTAAGATKVWNHPFDPRRTQSSPIVHDGRVFLMDDDQQFCWELATGKLLWNVSVPGSISSPVLADGKIFIPINNGNNLQIVKADGVRAELGKANVRSAWCPSPAIADGKLILRMKDGIKCFDVAATKPLP